MNKLLFYLTVLFLLVYSPFSILKSQTTPISPLPPPPPPPPTITIDPVSCHDYSDGSISVSNTPGTFLWSTGDTTASISGLSSGTYTVSITNHFGFNIHLIRTLSNPDTLTLSSTINPNIACSGTPNGSISVNLSGGATPYSYVWSTGDTFSSISNLAAGSYTITISDSLGCTKSESLTIIQPTTLLGTVQIDSNVSCYILSNGGVSAVASGGTSPYTYSWNDIPTSTTNGPPPPGGYTPYTFPGNLQLNTSFLSGIPGGTYFVTITDANGCSTTSNGVVTSPDSLEAGVAIDSNATCNGFSDGGVSAGVNGGIGPFSYLWNNNDTTASITGLPVGTYTVTITDQNGCTATDDEPVSEPPVLTVTTALDSSITCHGLSTAGVTAQGAGGSPYFGGTPYNYTWNNNSWGASLTGIPVGTYTVTVSDENGCTVSTSVNIHEPDTLVSAINIDSSITCFGLSNGGASASATGGIIPYTYSWNNNNTTSSITGVSANTYTVTITDQNGCTDSTSISFIQPDTLIASINLDSNVSCFGLSNAGATSIATGGTIPFSYVWSNTGPTDHITGVIAATYTVTITDHNGCSDTASIELTQPDTLIASISIDSLITCFGDADGKLSSAATGGNGNYSYAWNTATNTSVFANTSSVSALNSNTYYLTITDANNCSDTASIFLADPNLLTSTITIDSNVTCYGGSNGGLTSIATGGTGALSLLWNNGDTNVSITGLTALTYTVTITDSKGCTHTSSKTVTESNQIIVDLGNDTSVCLGSTLTLDAGAGFQSYLWNDNATSQTNNVNTNIANVADYEVTVTDNNGCNGMDTIEVTVHQPSTVSISGVSNLCSYEIDTLSATSGFASYLWNTNDTSSDLIIDATVLPSGNQNYSITATDTNGCLSDTSVSFNVFNPVIVDLGPDTSITIYGGGLISYPLDAGPGFQSYLWNDSTTTQVYLVTYPNMGTYHVTVTDSNGCLGSDTVIVDFILDIPSIHSGSISIYPNPVSEYLNIEMAHFNGQSVQITLTNVTGKIMYNQNIEVNGNLNSFVDVSQFPTGTYFIQIQANDQKMVKQIIIQ